MGYAKVFGAQTQLAASTTIHIEADISRGLHSFVIVGLANKSVEESKDRVAAAIKNSGLTSPKQHNRKVVISLAPADMKKEGPIFDVAIAMAYLIAAEEITLDTDCDISKTMFLGELSLDGKLRPIRGVLPIVLHAKKSGFADIFIPKENLAEANAVEGVHIHAADTLNEIIRHIEGKEKIPSIKNKDEEMHNSKSIDVDFADIHGQDMAKRGLEIAATGKHNVALYGAPGSGKTMLAKAFRHILPSLTFEESMEVTSIYSLHNEMTGIVRDAPFRSPHHLSSASAILGGGNALRIGEITLAHKGVLFLDEFPEFDRRVIESLREPLEEKSISIARAGGTIRFPADIILITAMNPCPCGFYGALVNPGEISRCVCTRQGIANYRKKCSGPIMDRIDMWINVSNVSTKKLSAHAKEGCDTTTEIQRRVEETRLRMQKYMETSENIKLSTEAEQILQSSAEKLGISARRYARTIRLAQTIAYMEKQKDILPKHVLEALQYRPK